MLPYMDTLQGGFASKVRPLGQSRTRVFNGILSYRPRDRGTSEVE